MTRVRLVMWGWVMVGLAGAARAQTLPRAEGPATRETPTTQGFYDSLAAAARATTRRLETTPARWRVDWRVPDGNGIRCDVVSTPTMRKLTFSTGRWLASTMVAEVIERDGVWYVREGEAAVKARPHEYAFQVSSLSLLRELAGLWAVVDASEASLGAVVAETGDVAEFRAPLPPAVRAQLEGAMASAEKALGSDPESLRRIRESPQFQEIARTLKDGLPLRVDTTHGIILGRTTQKLETTVSGFEWLGEVPAAEFDVSGRSWADQSAPIAEERPGDLVMLLHAATWRRGAASGDFDVRLLNLKTGEIRRVAYEGGLALPVCFGAGRRRVIVKGIDTDQGGMALHEVDLATGVNRPFGGPYHHGMALASLSPDGRTLFLLHSDLQNLMQKQGVLVDLTTGTPQPVGAPMDVAFPSWAPDGQSVVMVDMSSPDPKVVRRRIVRMDLRGNVTHLREGSMPLALPDGRILFEEDEALYTLDAAGGDKRSFFGLRRHGFPSLAPDGERVMLIDFEGAPGPTPVIVDLKTGG